MTIMGILMAIIGYTTCDACKGEGKIPSGVACDFCLGKGLVPVDVIDPKDAAKPAKKKSGTFKRA